MEIFGISKLVPGIICMVLSLAVVAQCWLVMDGQTYEHMMTAYSALT